MAGGYLRGNFRRLTGVVPIDGIGGGRPRASAAAGAGTTHPYGGFIWLAVCAPVVSAQAGQTLPSSRVIVSTYDLMGSYFGAGVFDSGYAFHPVVVYNRSVLSGAGMVWAAEVGEQATSGIYVVNVSLRHSGSYALWTPLVMMAGAGGASQYSFLSLSYCSGVWEVGGFIVSTP